jgi:hypothetical protein
LGAIYFPRDVYIECRKRPIVLETANTMVCMPCFQMSGERLARILDANDFESASPVVSRGDNVRVLLQYAKAIRTRRTMCGTLCNPRIEVCTPVFGEYLKDGDNACSVWRLEYYHHHHYG